MSHRNVFYYDEASNLTCVRDPDLGLTYYVSGKRSQERARSFLPWQLTSPGRGCRAVCAAA